MTARDALPLMQPPHSLEAEAAVLGALLIDNGAIDRLEGLPTEAFYRFENRRIYSAAVSLIVAGKAADVITVFEATKTDGGKVCVPVPLAILNELTAGVVSSSSIGRYARIVRDKHLERRLIAAADAISMVAYGADPTGIKLDVAVAEISRVAEQEQRKESATVSEALARHVSLLEDRSSDKVRRLPTGFADWDARLSGGMKRGQLIVLAARPAVGKTALALNVACNCARSGLSVLFLSQEMTEDELMDRVMAQVGRIPLDALEVGMREHSDDLWNRYVDAAETVRGWSLTLDEQAALTLLDIRSKALACKRRSGLDVLVLDYLQLCAGTDAKDKRNSQIEEITRGLKALAKDVGIVILALSQLNREADKRADGRPGLADLRDSGAIEQDADVVAFLHRPKDALHGDDAEYRELILGKVRQGKTGVLSLRYEGCFTLMQPLHGNIPRGSVARSYDKEL
ncbi:MAG: replicative DNA helicase [Burkholderiales bacterium]|nr:replicative DNA helicase [Burkholderiales bacterium]